MKLLPYLWCMLNRSISAGATVKHNDCNRSLNFSRSVAKYTFMNMLLSAALYLHNLNTESYPPKMLLSQKTASILLFLERTSLK